MAQPKEPAITDARRRKDELIASLARARTGMALHAGQISYQADVGRRVKSSFRDHLGRWIAGAFVTGGFVSLLQARTKKVYVSAAEGEAGIAPRKGRGGFWRWLFAAAVRLARPILTAFITRQLSSIIGGAKDAQVAAEHTARAAERTLRTATRAS